MKYKNAKNVLPEKLLNELQKYVQGEIIYVPGNSSTRVGWGEANGTREKYAERNIEILRLYRNGISTEKIAEKFYLSEYSIKKIISDSKQKLCSLKSIAT